MTFTLNRPHLAAVAWAASTTFAGLMGCSFAALAAVTAEETKQFGTTLTRFGAIKAELVPVQTRVVQQRHDMKNVAANGNVVFTEHVDWSFTKDRWASIPLVAVFELNDAGQITAWREYLDVAAVSKQRGMTSDELHASLAV